MTKVIALPLAERDYDPSEAAVAWLALTQAGYKVVFATLTGNIAKPDPMMLSGEGLDPWGWIPIVKKIKFIGLFLRADSNSLKAHEKMVKSTEFQNPMKYCDLKTTAYDGLYLPGGHCKTGIRGYLEDKNLQNFAAEFFESGKPVAAVCHGVLVLARSISKKTGKSCLYGHTTTALTWKLESAAWNLTYFTRFWDRHYYRTYTEEPGHPAGYMGVEQEVTRALESPDDFKNVPGDVENHWRKDSGMVRDSPSDFRAAWVVESGHYLSGRWPGDVHCLVYRFIEKLKE
eukprot:TRINITY_DN63_c6_g1_i1.p1 TRINITY_DN63_c6_g1~~TRINITY_DN63_c6_g1_i1.p1  ORF type:complete len:306 (+),score=30.13 TRINITY_DN63_c6_g1_i1:58-918(+)